MRWNFPQGKAGSSLSGSQSFPHQMCTWKPNFFRFLFPDHQPSVSSKILIPSWSWFYPHLGCAEG